MKELFDALQAARDELEKAVHNGERGKFRRMAGKTAFIRSSDKKIVRGPSDVKGKTYVEKTTDVTAAGMKEDLGSPSAEVLMTDGVKKPKKKPKALDAMVKSIDGLIDTLRSMQPSCEETDKK